MLPGAAMKRVRVVTDSIADIPANLRSELDISVVPCQVTIGKESYRDGVDLSPQAFLEKMAKSQELPRTSQPILGDLVETYRHLLERGEVESVISIHVAGNLSGTVNAAWAAVQMLPDPSKVEVIDSGQLSMGMGWAVIKAAEMAQAGSTHAEVSRAVRDLLPRMRVAAMLDTLENLYKGGRINQISAALGTVLQIKPLLSVQSGRISVFDKVRTRSRALSKLVAHVLNWGPLAELAILHTGAEELALTLSGRLQDLSAPHHRGIPFPAGRIIICPAGSALATHVGAGAVGACALLQ